MAEFLLEVYTTEKKEYDGYVSSIIIPGEEGYLGVLARHAPLLTTLGDGILTVRKGDERRGYPIKGGFLEVRDNRAIVLADSFGTPAEAPSA